jgi:hypothetical protein
MFLRNCSFATLLDFTRFCERIRPPRTTKSVQPGQSSQSNAANQVSPTRPIKSVQRGQSSQSNPDNQVSPTRTINQEVERVGKTPVKSRQKTEGKKTSSG